MSPSSIQDPSRSLSRDSDAASGPRQADPEAEVPSAILELVLSQWRIALVVPVVVIVLVVSILLVMPRRYTSDASFIVEAPPNGSMSSAMAIISQLNPNLAGGDSPKFYVDLVQSRPVLEDMLRLRLREQCGAAPDRTLLDRLEPSGGTELERLASGVETLAGRVGASYDLRTGVIGVSMEADCPAQARELTDSLIAAVNTFNVDRRQTRAKLRREFAEARAAEAETALRQSEDRLAGFLATNRVIASPQLKLEHDRLERRVSMRSEIATALRREASTARLDEINSMPALTVIDPPDTPIRASYPKRRLITLVAAFAAVIIGLGTALLIALVRPLSPDASAAAARLHQRARVRSRAIIRR